MRSKAKKLGVVLLMLAVPLLLSGCICWPCWWDDAPPHRAMIHVYVYDYYSGMPISWAVAELYEDDFWCWDYVGSWPTDPGGHAMLYGGYLEHDGCAGCDSETYRIVVSASGYYVESCEFRLDYYHPTESIYFYLLPCYCRDGADDGEAPDLPETERPDGRVLIGQPRDAGSGQAEQNEEGAP